MTPTLHKSDAGVTGSSLATSGEQNSGVAYLACRFLFGLYVRPKPKSDTFSSPDD